MAPEIMFLLQPVIPFSETVERLARACFLYRVARLIDET